MKSEPERMLSPEAVAGFQSEIHRAADHFAGAVVTALEARPPVNVRPAPYVTVKLAATLTGLSEKAIRRKIEEGKWLEGREYFKSPDGGIFISIEGYSAWIEQGAGSDSSHHERHHRDLR
jgi:hypothetical protein